MWDCGVPNDNETSPVQSLVQPAALVICMVNDSAGPAQVSALVRDSELFKSALSPTIDILVGCYLIIAEILAIIFNGGVLAISVWKRKSLKASDSYVVCLAASDLGHPLVAYPMIIASSFKHSWIFGNAGCLWNGFTGFFFGVNSMMILSVMSLSRLLIITSSDFARKHSRSIAYCLIFTSISFALFWAICPIFGWGEYGPEPYRTSCTLKWNEPDKSFVTASFVGCLAFPACIMSYSYVRILCVALETRHKRLQWVARNNEMKVWEKKEMRLLKMTVLMCSTFMLCWTPYAVLAMIKSYSDTVTWPAALSILPALAAKTSHVIDPVIYCGMNKNFSRHIHDIFREKRELDREQTTQSMPLRHYLRDSPT